MNFRDKIRAHEAASKVLRRKGSSKAEKSKRGSALTQTNFTKRHYLKPVPKPVKLAEVRSKPNADVISQLEYCLSDAKKGLLVEIDLCARMSTGEIYSTYAGRAADMFKMYGIMMDRAQRYRERKIPKDEDWEEAT